MEGTPDSTPASVPTSAFEALDRAIEATLARWKRSETPVSLLFSGGVDSGVLAWELRGRASTTLLTVGLEESADLVAARAMAPAIGLAWQGGAVGPRELRDALGRYSPELDGLPPGRRSIFLALAVAIDRAPTTDLLCGQGADELFLGYAHFRGLTEAACAATADSDLERLLREDWPRTVRLAERAGRRIHAPFLDPAFIAAARAIPTVVRMPTPGPKALWRSWARSRGVPSSIADRPKRALQFGTGIDAWLRRAPDA
jgi:asparagine synthase (glutamine-hydrolysing)